MTRFDDSEETWENLTEAWLSGEPLSPEAAAFVRAHKTWDLGQSVLLGLLLDAIEGGGARPSLDVRARIFVALKDGVCPADLAGEARRVLERVNVAVTRAELVAALSAKDTSPTLFHYANMAIGNVRS